MRVKHIRNFLLYYFYDLIDFSNHQKWWFLYQNRHDFDMDNDTIRTVRSGHEKRTVKESTSVKETLVGKIVIFDENLLFFRFWIFSFWIRE